MTLESALTYLVALALPVWLVVEQVMILRGRAKRQGAQAESGRDPAVAPSRAAEPGSGIVMTAPDLGRKAAREAAVGSRSRYGAAMTPAASRSAMWPLS